MTHCTSWTASGLRPRLGQRAWCLCKRISFSAASDSTGVKIFVWFDSTRPISNSSYQLFIRAISLFLSIFCLIISVWLLYAIVDSLFFIFITLQRHYTYRTIIGLPILLYCCETWSLALSEEHRLREFENKVLRPSCKEVKPELEQNIYLELCLTSNFWLYKNKPQVILS